MSNKVFTTSGPCHDSLLDHAPQRHGLQRNNRAQLREEIPAQALHAAVGGKRHFQFEQLSGQIAEAEAKRAEAMNLVLGFVVAAIGAPDWADAAGVESLGGMLVLGLIIFVAMFAVVALMQAVFKMARR